MCEQNFPQLVLRNERNVMDQGAEEKTERGGSSTRNENQGNPRLS